MQMMSFEAKTFTLYTFFIAILHQGQQCPCINPSEVLDTCLDTVLRQMTAGTYSKREVEDLTPAQKVKLLRGWLVPPAQRLSCSRPPGLHSNVSQVGLEVNERSRSLLGDITFSDFIKETLYPNQTIVAIEAFTD